MIKKKILNYIKASRAETLFISIAPILIGLSILIKEHISINYFILFLTCVYALFIQLGTNFSNDYYDYLKGADKDKDMGPERCILKGLINPRTVKTSFILSYFISLITGLYLSYLYGWYILPITIICILSGYFYTAGKKAIAYLGLGEFFVIFFFGILPVEGTFFLQTKNIEIYPIILGVGIGLISTAILIANNLRDVNEDFLVNKKTITVRFGKKLSKILYIFCILLSLCILTYYISHWISIFSIFAAIYLLTEFISIKKEVYYNGILQKTMFYSMIYTASFFISSFI